MEDIPRIIHIAPFGAENERIRKPAVKGRADLVVLIDYLPPGPYEQIHDEVRTGLEEANIDYTTEVYDIGDLFDAVAAFSEEITKYENQNENVQVNLASGDKVTAIGAMIAAMNSDNAQPYYVAAENAASVSPTPATNITNINDISAHPMERPEYQHLAIMELISRTENKSRVTDNDGPYRVKKELFEFGDDADLKFMAGATGESSNKENYGRLTRHIIKPLSKKGYIDTESIGQNKRVFLTEEGENTLQAFRHLLRDDTENEIAKRIEEEKRKTQEESR